MAKVKVKAVRVKVLITCNSCVRNGLNQESPGISRYLTQKNRHNTPSRLEWKSFCLSLLLQTYDSWGDRERDQMEGVCALPSRSRNN